MQAIDYVSDCLPLGKDLLMAADNFIFEKALAQILKYKVVNFEKLAKFLMETAKKGNKEWHFDLVHKNEDNDYFFKIPKELMNDISLYQEICNSLRIVLKKYGLMSCISHRDNNIQIMSDYII